MNNFVFVQVNKTNAIKFHVVISAPCWESSGSRKELFWSFNVTWEKCQDSSEPSKTNK